MFYALYIYCARGSVLAAAYTRHKHEAQSKDARKRPNLGLDPDLLILVHVAYRPI